MINEALTDSQKSLERELEQVIPKDFQPNQTLKARVWELVNQLAVEKEKYQSAKCQNEKPNIKIIIEYIYDFAWQYGRFYHIGDADKIKAAISERFQLPEEALPLLLNIKEGALPTISDNIGQHPTNCNQQEL